MAFFFFFSPLDSELPSGCASHLKSLPFSSNTESSHMSHSFCFAMQIIMKIAHMKIGRWDKRHLFCFSSQKTVFILHI